MRIRFLIGVAFLLGAGACEQKTNCCDNNSDFNRKALLQHFSDNIIRPAFSALQLSTNVLHDQANAFVANPTLPALAALQERWETTALRFQFANAYNFGPAGEEGLRKGLIEEIGTFPVSETKINGLLAAGQWNLNDFNRDARGFYAIEFLIFSPVGDPAAIVQAFQTNPAKAAYLAALTKDLKDRADAVVTAWSGSFAGTFVQNDGTDAGSSVAVLYNEFVRSYEAAKNFKVGLPMGKRAGQTQSEPQLVEAWYSGKSLPLLKAHLNAIENIWYGRTDSGQEGPGFKSYLDTVEGGKALIVSTESQLAALKTALGAVASAPALSDQIIQKEPKLEALYEEMQKMVRFFKSDLSSLLGIAITYSSGDGD